MSGATTSTAYSKLVQIALCITFALVFLASICRYILYPNDRSRCKSMLNDGWWLDPSKHNKWQPAGCIMHTYDASQTAVCLNHSRVLYVGDSIARTQFFSFVKMIRPDADTTGEKHSDRLYKFNDLQLTLEFWWDPYLNTTRTSDMLKTINPATQPSLLVMGTGAWYMRYLDENYKEDWQDAMDRVFDAVQRSSRVADAVILSPVEVPKYELLSPDRQRTMSIERVDSMNTYLKNRQESLNALTPLVIPFVWNKMTYGIDDITEDGLHFDTPTTTSQVQLALNYRCNNQLPKHFPLDSTCCFQYPVPKWYQAIYFVFFLAWVPIGLYVISSEKGLLAVARRIFPSEKVLDALFIFGLGVIYMYFGDRTQIFGKAQKNFDSIAFGALCLATLAAGILTLKSKREGDQGFLNRDQTDEWKGWMQIIILIYHFLGASSISGIYNPIRILVAAYLFQTGYGHFFFFYKKADFGLSRVLNVMVRLNLLTFVLQYVMDTDYLSYYFTPLVSFWFLIIWITMYAGHRANTTPWFLLGKIAAAAVATTILIHAPGVLEDIFSVLRLLFNVDWNAAEWRFRLGLDAWIVYIGMLFAYGTIKFTEHRLQEHPSYAKAKKLTLIASVVAMAGYFLFELSCENKIVYNHYHPYISWIPILAFIALRNATVKARNTSSKFFIFFGRISLETFIGQFHMWLAGDTKGLLVVLAHPSAAQGIGWWLNFIVSSALFVFVSYHLSQSTGTMTKWICSALCSQGENNARPNQREYQAVPLLPTSTREATADTQEDVPKNNQEEVAETEATRQEGIEDWAEERGGQAPILDKLWNLRLDARIKVTVIVVSIGLVNRFC